jgi:hypothetical protein
MRCACARIHTSSSSTTTSRRGWGWWNGGRTNRDGHVLIHARPCLYLKRQLIVLRLTSPHFPPLRPGESPVPHSCLAPICRMPVKAFNTGRDNIAKSVHQE